MLGSPAADDADAAGQAHCANSGDVGPGCARELRRHARRRPTSTIQQSIARIHEACQAPPLAPPEYRALFEVMALEINENNLLGAQTIQNVLRRAQEHGLELRKDDVRFVMDVVSEADPWFEQGASANLFAGRFRNFVVARCRGQGLEAVGGRTRPDRGVVRRQWRADIGAGRRHGTSLHATAERSGTCRLSDPRRCGADRGRIRQ